MTIIEEWAKLFDTTPEKWDFWKREVGASDKIIMAGPSRILGLVDLTKITENIEWTPYSKCSEPTKKMNGNFLFDGNMYGVYFLRVIYPLLPETVGVTKYKEGILFKLTEDIAVGIGGRINHEEFYYNDEGVMFVEYDWWETKDEWKTTVTEKEFVKWENNVAKRKHKGKTYVWNETIYKFEYFFEDEEEFGDMMQI